MAQSYNSGTKIDEEERKRLENQFKALKTFYINDDGLVVYQTQPTDQTATNDDNAAETTSQETSSEVYSEPSYTTTTPVETESAIPVVSRNETEYSENSASVVEPSNTSTSGNYGSNVFMNKKPVNSLTIQTRTEPKQPEPQPEPVSTGTITVNRSQWGESEAAPSNISTIEEQKSNLSTPVEATTTIAETISPEEAEEVRPSAKSTVTSKKSIFEKNPSKYKNMEEAALAADALLEQLKKEQAQSSGSGSMSSRIARGAGGRSTLRKQVLLDESIMNDNSYDNSSGYNNSSSTTSQSNRTQTIIEPEEYDIPTYYINGQRVDKAEVDALNKKDIISREIRTRNTVSGNPAGEVWYEVRGE